MSAEDRKFLERVMKEMCVDPADRTKQLLQVITFPLPNDPVLRDSSLKLHLPEQAGPVALLGPPPALVPEGQQVSPLTPLSPNSPAPDTNLEPTPQQTAIMVEHELSGLSEPELIKRKVAAFEELDDLVGQIDAAVDLHKLGGLRPMLLLLDSTRPELQAYAAQIIATVTQNNPQAQAFAMQLAALPRLIRATSRTLDSSNSAAENKTSDSALVTAKLLLAISALIKPNDAIAQAFLALHGHALLLRLLTSASVTQSPRVLTKLLLLLRYLWSFASPRKELVSESGSAGLRAIAEALRHADLDVREAALRAVLQLIEEPAVLQHLRTSTSGAAGLCQIARDRHASIAGLQADEDRLQLKDELELLDQLLAALQ